MDTATPRSFDELLEAYWACAYQEGLEKREHDNETGDAQRTLADLLDAWQQKERETIAQAERIVVLEAALREICIGATPTDNGRWDVVYRRCLDIARQALGSSK